MSEIDYDDSWPYPDDDSDRWEELVNETFEAQVEEDQGWHPWHPGHWACDIPGIEFD